MTLAAGYLLFTGWDTTPALVWGKYGRAGGDRTKRGWGFMADRLDP